VHTLDPWTAGDSPTTLGGRHLDRSEAAMRLGRRLSAGIAEDPPAPGRPDAAEIPETAEIPAEIVEATAERREPAEQLVDR
jgi:hypothetical protein